jgi:soluble lytic murein transglycosylase-like protein
MLAFSEQLKATVELMGKAWALDPNLISAIIMQETGGNPWLTRFEPAWQYWEKPTDFAALNRISQATEKALQAMSWGPMQIMGSVAREQGFNQELTRLSALEFSMTYSCKKLASLILKYKNEDDAIAAWNAGSPRKRADGTYSNQSYVDGVQSFLKQLRPQA